MSCKLAKAVDPTEDVPDPDPLSACTLTKAVDPTEDVPDPDPLVGSSKWRFAACRSGERDDHGDESICATSLGLPQSLRGTITNSWGDDRDCFVFALADWSTIAIESSGGTDVDGALYDSDGVRVAVDEDSGELDNFRITKTLPPGRYYVHVEGGDRAEGEYVISADLLSR